MTVVLPELDDNHVDHDEPTHCHVMVDWNSNVALCGKVCQGKGTAHVGNKYDGTTCEECGRPQCLTCLSLLPLSRWSKRAK